MAFYSLELKAGDRILTANAEHASNYIALRQVADRTGAAVVVVPDDEHGQVDVAALASMLDDRVKLRERLAANDGVQIHDRGEELCGIVTFSVAGHTTEAVVGALVEDGINVSLSPGIHSRLDLGRRGLESVVRASAHYYNEPAELDRLVERVARF